MNIILLGAPGSGKGTQAEVLCRKLGIPAISTGNILREAIRNGTEVGLAAKAYTDTGRLVPDDVIVGIIRQRLMEPDCQNGFLLDGFPRTLPQAEALSDIGVPLHFALSLEVPDSDIERRMAGRRVCGDCGASYHIENKPPRAEGLCDSCGGALSQRADDAPETVRARLDTFHQTTEPIKGYYEKLGILRMVAATGSIEEIASALLAALGVDA